MRLVAKKSWLNVVDPEGSTSTAVAEAPNLRPHTVEPPVIVWHGTLIPPLLPGTALEAASTLVVARRMKKKLMVVIEYISYISMEGGRDKKDS